MLTSTTKRGGEREKRDELEEEEEEEEVEEDWEEAIEQNRAATQSLTSQQRNYAQIATTTSSNVVVSTVSSTHYSMGSCHNHNHYHHQNSTENNRLQRPLNYTIEEEVVTKNPATMPSPIPYLPPLTDSDYRTQSEGSSSSSSSDEPHMSACESLLEVEERFIELMQRGVQQYSRPLRHCAMISAHEHETLFQNIEKILAISEYQLSQLISRDASMLLDMFATIGRLYENKMRMSGEAFDLYLSGVGASLDLLNSLTSGGINSKLSRFLADSQTDLPLVSFLLLPLHYVSEIRTCLIEIRRHTSPSNADHATLCALITRLDGYVERSRVLLVGHENPLTANSSGGQEDDEDEDLIDEDDEEYSSEVEIEERDYNHNNRYITVTTAPNQLIYSSSLYYRQSCHKWKKIRALFFADRCIMLDSNVRICDFKC